MAEVYNAIWIGYPFAQDFETEAGVIPDDASLWMDLQRARSPHVVFARRVYLQRLSATTFRLSLSAEQTAAFEAGAAEGDFIIEDSASDRPLGVRVTIPVLVPASQP